MPLHGLYDFFVFDDLLRPAGALMILAVWIWRMRLIRGMHRLLHPPPRPDAAPEE